MDENKPQENKENLEKLGNTTSNEALYDVVKILRKGVINHIKELNNKED
jgi:hypothetical protein